MSQRLFIGPDPKEGMDCVIKGTPTIQEIRRMLLGEWLRLRGGSYSGPWKVWIKDVKLFKRVARQAKRMFETLGHKWPECVWCFYYDSKTLEHPSQKELDGLIHQKS